MSGIIYKIVCNETDECYVGSTIQGLAKRMAVHKCLNQKKTGGDRNLQDRENDQGALAFSILKILVRTLDTNT